MNTHIRTLGLLTLALCAVEAQAYIYKVINYASKRHSAQMRFGKQDWLDFGFIMPEQRPPMPTNAHTKAFTIEGDWRYGLCLGSFAVDNKETKIMGINDTMLDAMKENRLNVDTLTALYKAGVKINDLSTCRNIDIYLFDTSSGIIAVTPDKSSSSGASAKAVTPGEFSPAGASAVPDFQPGMFQ